MLRIACELPRAPFTLNVDLSIEEGSAYCLFGPSAAGKSSILAAAAGFERPTRALIALGDDVLERTDPPPVHVPPWARRLGYLHQEARLFPHMTVRQNILYGARTDLRAIERLTEDLGIADYLDLDPGRLSGGLIQRAALARLLASKPRALLLDEPLSSLDQKGRRELEEEILTLREGLGLTLLFVTHQFTEAQRMADRIGILNQGRVLQEGTPEELVARPSSREVAELVGYTHFIRDPEDPGQVIGVHPNRVLLGERPDLGPVLRTSVLATVPHEGGRRAKLQTGGDVFEMTLPPTEQAAVGTELPVTLFRPPRFRE